MSIYVGRGGIYKMRFTYQHFVDLNIRDDCYELTETGAVYPAKHNSSGAEYHFNNGGLVIIPATLSWGDYVGSLVYKSNAQVFEKEFSNLEGDGWEWRYEHYNAEMIMIYAHKLTDEIVEFLGKLDDYPVADEDHLAQVEVDAQSEVWDNYYRSEFKQLLEGIIESRLPLLDEDWDSDVDGEGVLELLGVDNDKLWEYFNSLCSSSNTYWTEESGTQQVIDLDRVVKGVTYTDIVEYFT